MRGQWSDKGVCIMAICVILVSSTLPTVKCNFSGLHFSRLVHTYIFNTTNYKFSNVM